MLRRRDKTDGSRVGPEPGTLAIAGAAAVLDLLHGIVLHFS
ncbi:MAG: hypothetical protein ACREMB_05135 [Candidatus Rokuibacteriota bacterium]